MKRKVEKVPFPCRPPPFFHRAFREALTGGVRRNGRRIR